MRRIAAWTFLLFISLTPVCLPAAGAGVSQCADAFASSRIAERKLSLSEIHYVVLGSQNPGDPIVFIHGVGSELSTFRSVAESLAKNEKVILYDLRGHGRTVDPEADYDLPTLVNDLETLVSGLNLTRVRIIGHSAGGKIAMLFAAKHPQLVSSLVIEDVGVSPLAPPSTIFSASENETHNEAQFLRSLTDNYTSLEKLTEDLMPLSGFDREKSAELAAKVLPVGTKRSAATMEFWKSFKHTDTSQFLTEFKNPVLFLRAEPATRYFPEKDVRTISELMPNAKVAGIAGGSHSIHEKKPNEWLLNVTRFLSLPESRSATLCQPAMRN